VLDELIERHGEGAIITVRPYVLDSGETLRWIVEINGVDVPDVDVAVRPDSERTDVMVMLLVYGGEEVELDHWSTTKSKIRAGPSSRAHWAI
jgi:hypothetical protein